MVLFFVSVKNPASPSEHPEAKEYALDPAKRGRPHCPGPEGGRLILHGLLTWVTFILIYVYI